MLIKISLSGEDDWEARLIENLEKKEQSFFSNMSWYFSDLNESEVCSFFFFFFFFSYLTFFYNFDPQFLLWQMAVTRTSLFFFKKFCLIYSIYLLTLFISYFLFFSCLIIVIYLLLCVRKPIWKEGNLFDWYILNVSQDVARWRCTSALLQIL